MLDKMSTQQRVILAVSLAFLFYVLYAYFFIPRQPVVSNQNATKMEFNTNKVPQTSDISVVKAVPSSQNSETNEVITYIKSDEFEIHIDKFGRISRYFLNGENFKDDNGQRIQLIDESFNLLPLEVRFSDTNLYKEAFEISYAASTSEILLKDEPQTLVLTQKLSDVDVVKKITFTKDKGYIIEVSLSQPKSYFISTGFRPNQLADGYAFHGAIVKKADGSLEKIDDGDLKKQENFVGAYFAAASDRYYTTLLASTDENEGIDVSILPVSDKNPNIFIKGKEDLKLQGYIGPKSRAAIYAVDEKLDDVIEYGFFTLLSKPIFSLLYFIHSKVGNWGWSIVIITILIRLVLYPLTYRGMVSMNKIKDLMPKVKELQVKYKDDKQKLNIHMMDLYKKHGANPMGGCLPILIQIPIFFAIYRVLVNTIELKNAEWILWVKDLAVMDPYYILPVAMGLTMFLQQKITPSNFADPTQEKIMKFLPLIFTIFFLWFPAGLTLYWFVNNLFSIAQQMYVNRIFKNKKAAAIKEKA
ncbi:MAG: membrane protein insertase YidC [Campylobacteraceae bacterium]|nr:membrane protein insertase YidC [Campylobacteraceae bacterium]